MSRCALVLAALLALAAGTPSTHTSTTPATCTPVVTASTFDGWYSDHMTPAYYSSGEWVDESGDGRILGYAAEEDSSVFSSPECATTSR